MDYKKIIAIITIVVTTSLGGVGYLTEGFGIISQIDSRYAKAAELRKIDSKIDILNKKVDLGQMQQTKNEAWNEYFATKKLKKKHPQDEEINEMYEKAREDKNIITREYAALKAEIKKLIAKLKF